jgi:hypothetical protein
LRAEDFLGANAPGVLPSFGTAEAVSFRSTQRAAEFLRAIQLHDSGNQPGNRLQTSLDEVARARVIPPLGVVVLKDG